MRRLSRAAVVACVSVAIAWSFVYFVRTVDRLGDDARTHAAEHYDDREFAGGNSLVADKRALYEARALIPEDGSYRIVPGPRVAGATGLTEGYIDQYARYFLMPRRPDPDGRWIICYGCNPSEIERPAAVVWDGGGGISILQATE